MRAGRRRGDTQFRCYTESGSEQRCTSPRTKRTTLFVFVDDVLI